MEDPETMEDVISLLVRRTLEACFKEKNFLILKALPTNVKTLMKKMELTKVPVNNHLNELEKLGLLTRQRGTGKVYPTQITKGFLRMHRKTEKIIEKDIVFFVKKAIK